MEFKIINGAQTIICSYKEEDNLTYIEFNFYKDILDANDNIIDLHKVESHLHYYDVTEKKDDDTTFLKKVVDSYEWIKDKYEIIPL